MQRQRRTGYAGLPFSDQDEQDAADPSCADPVEARLSLDQPPMDGKLVRGLGNNPLPDCVMHSYQQRLREVCSDGASKV